MYSESTKAGLAGFVGSVIAVLVVVVAIAWVLNLLFAGVDNEQVEADMKTGNDGAAFAIGFAFLFLLFAGCGLYVILSWLIAIVTGVLAIRLALTKLSSLEDALGRELAAGAVMCGLEAAVILVLCGWSVMPYALDPYGAFTFSAFILLPAAGNLIIKLFFTFVGGQWYANRVLKQKAANILK